MSTPLNVHLEQYEGPLDLLLDLIRKQQINIYDIPIAKITAQYLDYLQKAIEFDIELGSDFVYMAATLIHIKSGVLLPRDPELAKIAGEEDPRKELVDRLLEHERFKNAAEMLQQKRIIEEATWSNPQIETFLADSQGPALKATVFDLVRTFQDILERAKNRPVYEIGRDAISVPDMLRFVHDQLALRRNEPLSATQLFEGQRSRLAMVCLFLAILELVKARNVELIQVEEFGDIGLRRGPGFDDVDKIAEELGDIEQEYR